MHESDIKMVDALSAWSHALRDPSLRDLPYKIETNEYGQIVMSAQKVWHGRMQSRIVQLLVECAGRAGASAVEFAMETSKGVKVADVIWASDERWEHISLEAEASHIAPEVCIEVLSKSNTEAEITEKRRLYFDRGAKEVWTCDGDGRVRYFTPSGEVPSSNVMPAFPSNVER